MNVSTARLRKEELRKDLREQIRTRIQKFEEETGVYIDGISVHTSHVDILTKDSQHKGDKEKTLHKTRVEIDTDL